MKQRKIQKMETGELAHNAVILLEALSERLAHEGWDYGSAFPLSFSVRQIQGIAEAMRAMSNAQLARHSQDFAELASASAIQPRDPFAD